MIEAARKERAVEAKRTFRESMDLARAAWASQPRQLKQCSEQLSIAAEHMPNCDLVHRFRCAAERVP